jgi:hypothetical protein
MAYVFYVAGPSPSSSTSVTSSSSSTSPLQVTHPHKHSRRDTEEWAESTARLINNLNEAEAEVLHLRDALRRSEAELEMEREQRRLTEEDNAIERQLRYEVEGDIEHVLARAVESERQCEKLHQRAAYMEALRREFHEERHDKLLWKWIVKRLTHGAHDLALEVGEEISQRVPLRRRLRIQRWVQEAHREMMLDREMSREGTPPR